MAPSKFKACAPHTLSHTPWIAIWKTGQICFSYKILLFVCQATFTLVVSFIKSLKMWTDFLPWIDQGRNISGTISQTNGYSRKSDHFCRCLLAQPTEGKGASNFKWCSNYFSFTPRSEKSIKCTSFPSDNLCLLDLRRLPKISSLS